MLFSFWGIYRSLTLFYSDDVRIGIYHIHNVVLCRHKVKY